jgi:hypothetical protein
VSPCSLCQHGLLACAVGRILECKLTDVLMILYCTTKRCVHTFDACHPCDADNVELGTACGKLHRVSVLAITDAGECCTSDGVMLVAFSHATALTPYWLPFGSWPSAAALTPHVLPHAGDSDIIKTQPGAEQAAA